MVLYTRHLATQLQRAANTYARRPFLLNPYLLIQSSKDLLCGVPPTPNNTFYSPFTLKINRNQRAQPLITAFVTALSLIKRRS